MSSIRLGNRSRLHIGDTGSTVTAMCPQGKIIIAGRLYDARSDGSWIEPKAGIVVVDGDHLGAIVRPLEGDRVPELDDYGLPTSEACWQRAAPERPADRGPRANDWHRFWIGVKESASLGAVYGLICASLGCAEAEMAGWMGPWLWAIAAALGGAVWGGLLFLFIHSVLRDLGEFEQLALVTLGLALVGSTGGTVAGYSVWGLIGGLTGAVLGAFCLGILVPFVIVAAQAMSGPTDSE